MGLFKKLFGIEEENSTPKSDAKGDLTLVTVYREFDDEDHEALNKHYEYEDDLWQFNNVGESQAFSRDIALEEGIPFHCMSLHNFLASLFKTIEVAKWIIQLLYLWQRISKVCSNF